MGSFDHRKFREWRLDSGLTREQVCVRAAPLSFPHLVSIESGTRDPSIALLQRLAAVFGRSPGELFTRDEAGAR
jgi:transcriptional regulator with XRE-family HTH domain